MAHLLLIDGTNWVHRAFYVPGPMLTTAAGVPTKTVTFYATMLWNLLNGPETRTYSHAAAVFDYPARNWRHDVWDGYKANRDAKAPELSRELLFALEASTAFGLPVIREPGYESDDCIATLTRRFLTIFPDGRVTICSSDKDLMQLLDHEGRVRMLDSLPKPPKWIGVLDCVDKWGVVPTLLADLLALAGDSSDGIPGVKKLGPVGAAKLLNTHGSISAVIHAAFAGLLTPRINENICAAADDLLRYRQIVALDESADIETTIAALAAPRSRDVRATIQFLESIESVRLLGEVKAKWGVPS